MTIQLRNTLVESISFFFILLFVYAASSKLLDIFTFRSVLAASPLLSNFAIFLSFGIPAVEIFIAGSLVIPKFRSFGLLATLLLMATFTLYIGYMVSFTPQLPCSCGGILKQLSWKGHFIFNSMATTLAYGGYSLQLKKQRTIAIARSSRIPVENSRQNQMI